MELLKNTAGENAGSSDHTLICIDIGCGNDRGEGMIGIDANPGPNVDIVRDITRGLPFCDRSVDFIKAHSVLEHIEGNDNFEFVISECWRVLTDDGILDVLVPGAFSDGGMRDPTHTRHFTKATFDYFKKGFPKNHEWMPETPWELLEVNGEDNGSIRAMLRPDRNKE